jgi:hypothetical protein
MKTNIESTDKKQYCSPQIERIKLDNEISLVLESTQPSGEPVWISARDNFVNDPFKTDIG